MRYWYIALLSVAFAVGLVIVETKKKPLPAIFIKAAASVCFVVLGILSYPGPGRGAGFILVALIFGAAGDVLLNLCNFVDKDQLVFFIGGSAFFIGHILYMCAFGPLAGSLLLPVAAVGVSLGLLIAFLLLRKQESDTLLKIETFGYLVTVSAMAAISVAVLIQGARTGGQAFTSGLLKGIGGVLFLASDSVLFYRIIHKKEDDWRSSLAVLMTYYPAQCLMALSMQFM